MIIHVSIQVNFEIVQCHPVNLREWSLTMGKDGGGGGGCYETGNGRTSFRVVFAEWGHVKFYPYEKGGDGKGFSHIEEGQKKFLFFKRQGTKWFTLS